MADNLRKTLHDALLQVGAQPIDRLLETRFQRLMSDGRIKEGSPS